MIATTCEKPSVRRQNRFLGILATLLFLSACTGSTPGVGGVDPSQTNGSSSFPAAATAPTPSAVYIHAGGNACEDSLGNIWSADMDYSGGMEEKFWKGVDGLS